MCPRSHSPGKGPTLKASLTHRLPKPDLRARPLPFQSEGPLSRKGRVRVVCGRSLLPCAPPPPSKAGPWRRRPRGLPPQVAHKEGRGGGGDHSAAGATGRAPPLPVSSTNGPSSCACAKGKLQLSKTKTPKEELPWRPWKTAGPPPRFRGLPGRQAGAGRRWVPALPPAAGLACCPMLPPRWTGDRLAERGAHKGGPRGLLPPPPGLAAGPGGGADALGLAEPPPYSPSFWEKIFSKVTSPRSSRYFCMTLRMLEDRGAVVTQSPHGSRQACWPCSPGGLLLPSLESGVESTAGGCQAPFQEGSHHVRPDHGSHQWDPREPVCPPKLCLPKLG